MSGRIFINYRRGDDPGNTGRLFDRLQEAFAPEQLFIDVDSIAPGLDFVRVLEEHVGQCDALLAVIGPRWLEAADQHGNRRLDNPEDFVRIEIESALNQGKRVIPVLVGEARMPRPDELPVTMRPLVRRNAVRLTHERFRADSQGLIKALQQALDDAVRHTLAEEERRRGEAAASERAKAQAEVEEQARRDKGQARLTAIAGLSTEQIAKAEELANWDFIKESTRAQDFRDHLARFPGGICERMARHKLAALSWAALGETPDRAALISYLEEFSEDAFAEQARTQLASLDRAAVEKVARVRQPEPRPTWSSPVLWIGVALTASLFGVWLVVVPATRTPAPPGLLTISGPDEVTFRGPQGGPFVPPRLSLQLRATGSDVRWWHAGAIPDWLGVTPDHGVLTADKSTEVVVTLTPRAQSLLPGSHDSRLVFKNEISGTTIGRAVHVVVSSPPPCAVSLASRAAQPLSSTEECALKSKDVFKECASCSEMVVVPAGSFTMGSPAREAGRVYNESQHAVTIARQFAVGRFAVTFDEWDACVSDGGCRQRLGDGGWGRERRPVINVTWTGAKAYVAWLSKKTGKSYRLLSEAEREYVTRAGTTTPFWWGNSISTSQANYNGNSTYGRGVKGEYRGRTLPVDSFEPNPWGLFQVHGNVNEWGEDCWHDTYAGAPSDGSAWTSGGDCDRRVVRGGRFDYSAQDLRAAFRGALNTEVLSTGLGFRVGRTLGP